MTEQGGDPLARELAAIAKDPARRSELLKRLGEATLACIGQGEPDPDGAVRIARLRQDGESIVPLFTSPEAARAFMGGEAPIAEFTGEELFSSFGRDAVFVVNPGTGAAITVRAEEFGGETGASSGAATAPPSGPGLSGEDARRLLAALVPVLEERLEVRAAYAGNLVHEGVSRLVIGLDLEPGSDEKPVVEALTAVLRATPPEDAVVDLVLLDRSEGPLADALRGGEPFYKRASEGG